jgi:hypothetical protein
MKRLPYVVLLIIVGAMISPVMLEYRHESVSETLGVAYITAIWFIVGMGLLISYVGLVAKAVAGKNQHLGQRIHVLPALSVSCGFVAVEFVVYWKLFIQ